MKKFLLSFCLCFVALATMAQKSYTEDINVTLKQELDGQLTEAPLPTAPGKIEVTQNNDGTCDFLLRNFVLSMGEDGTIYVGNINLKAVKMTTGANGKTAIETLQTITIEPGDDMEGVSWIGPMLGQVPIDLKGSMDDQHMNAVIDIDLKESMNMNVNVVIGTVNLVFTEDINVTLKQELDGQLTEAPLPTAPGKIEVTQNNDGTCDFLLRNFVLSMGEDGTIYVGNINLKAVKMTTGANGKTAIETLQTITIEPGDDMEGVSWIGPMLGQVPIDLKGSMDNQHMNAVIDIDLKETMNMNVNVVIGKKSDTGITEAAMVAVKHTGVYNLNGLRVADEMNSSLPAGIYIVNGKKTAVK